MGMDAHLVLAALVFTVWYGYKSRKNMAPLALTFAFLIGCVKMGISPKELILSLPVQIMFNIFAITFFFGFATRNGTLPAVVNRCLYRIQKHTYAVMPLIFLFGFLTALLGAGIYAAAFIAPLAFQTAEETKTKPILAYIATVCGTAAGSNFVSSAGGVVVHGILNNTEYVDQAYQITMNGFLWSLAIECTCFFAAYVLFRGWKCEGILQREKMEMSTVQKKTVTLIAVVAAIVILPGMLASVFQISWFGELGRRLDTGLLMISGGCIASIWKLGDDRKVLSESVPWGTIVILGGVSVLIQVGKSAGLIESLAALVSSHMPVRLIAPVMALIAGLMSMCSSAVSVVIPTLYPLIPPIASSTGVSAPALYAAVFVAATATGASPLSTNGSLALGGCYKEHVRGPLFYQAVPIPFTMLVMIGLICFCV